MQDESDVGAQDRGPDAASRRTWPRPAPKTVIPFLIALVSVTGAVATWRAAKLAERATDKDRQLINETVLVAQSEANVAARVQSEVEAYSRYQAELVNASTLEKQAQDLRAQGMSDEAADLESEARAHRDAAENLASLSLPVDLEDRYLRDGVFDSERRRQALGRELHEHATAVNPQTTVRDADRLANRSQRLVGWIVLFAAVVFMLTVAQVTRRQRLQEVLALAGACAYVAVGIAAFTGSGAG